MLWLVRHPLRTGTGTALVAAAVLAAGASILAQSPPPSPPAPPRDVADILAGLRAAAFPARRNAVRACRGRNEPELLDALRESAASDPHPTIRAFALDELAAARVPDLFEVARDALGRETVPFSTEAALRALGASGDPRAFALLVPHLDGPHAGPAALGLGALGDVRAFDLVARLLDRDPEGDWRKQDALAAAARALVQLDRDAGVDLLLARFASGPELAGAAVGALADQPLPRVRQAMLAALEADDPAVRRAAARVLAAVVDATCMGKLFDLLDSEPDMAIELAPVLGRSGFTPAAQPLCARLLHEEDGACRLALATALRSLRDPAIAPDLLRALARESDALVRVELVAALGAQGNALAVARLLELVDDDTVTRQRPELSRILAYPYNVRLGDVATWAAATLVDGREPFPVETLSAFPRPAPRQACAEVHARLLAWWKSLDDRDRYGDR